MKWRFAAIFLLAFALLQALWWANDCASRFRLAVLATAQVVSPIVNGWWLEYDPPGKAGEAVFRAGDRKLHLLLQLPALSMGLVPFLALVLATPGLGIKRAAVAGAAGGVLYLLIDVAVVLAYPLIMDRPNALKDTLGVFSGLMAFVVAPLGLWFALTYSTLRSLWGLSPLPPLSPPRPARPPARGRRRA
ncbi:MAG: hypothetical protein HY699_05895 [Deltaproteobacteria bacterium]|nr:hypothetical protein [Deltaproteobacteria bacterium]